MGELQEKYEPAVPADGGIVLTGGVVPAKVEEPPRRQEPPPPQQQQERPTTPLTTREETRWRERMERLNRLDDGDAQPPVPSVPSLATPREDMSSRRASTSSSIISPSGEVHAAYSLCCIISHTGQLATVGRGRAQDEVADTQTRAAHSLPRRSACRA